jgi:ABC-type amino acid transport substrate-binding protein
MPKEGGYRAAIKDARLGCAEVDSDGLLMQRQATQGVTIMKWTIFILTILALLIAACAAPAKPTTPAAVEEPGEGQLPDLGGRALTVGTDPFPPYTVVADDGSITGFEADLLNEICKLLNCTATYKVVAWDGIFTSLAAGEFDVVGGGAVYSKERDEIVDFTIPYYKAGAAVVVRNDETELKVPDDLLKPGIVTGVMTGDMSESTAIEFGIPDDQLKHYATADLQYLALLNGDVDAIIQLSDSIGAFVYGVYEGKMKVLSDDKGPILMSEDTVHLVMSHQETELREAFDAALKQLIQDGTVAKLLTKWDMVVAIPE